MKKKLGILAAAVLASVLLGAGSCEPPCAKLAPPTAEQVKLTEQGLEIERELANGTECVVSVSDDGKTASWQPDY